MNVELQDFQTYPKVLTIRVEGLPSLRGRAMMGYYTALPSRTNPRTVGSQTQTLLLANHSIYQLLEPQKVCPNRTKDYMLSQISPGPIVPRGW